MYCTVYPLYRGGVRLPAAEAQASGTRGWLVYRYKLKTVGMICPRAILLPQEDSPPTHELMRIDSAYLVLICGGIRLVGAEPIEH